MTEPESPLPVPFIIPNCVEVVIHAQKDSNERCNVIHYRYEGSAPTASELEDLTEQVELSIIEAQEDMTFQGCQYYKITAFDLGDPYGAFWERAILRVGADANSPATSQTSFCLSKRSGVRGRKNHGRYYLFDLTEPFFNGDTLNIVYLPLLNNLAENLLEIRLSGRFVPAIASRTYFTTVPIRSFSWDFTTDTQRRRIPGRGA